MRRKALKENSNQTRTEQRLENHLQPATDSRAIDYPAQESVNYIPIILSGVDIGLFFIFLTYINWPTQNKESPEKQVGYEYIIPSALALLVIFIYASVWQKKINISEIKRNLKILEMIENEKKQILKTMKKNNKSLYDHDNANIFVDSFFNYLAKCLNVSLDLELYLRTETINSFYIKNTCTANALTLLLNTARTNSEKIAHLGLIISTIEKRYLEIEDKSDSPHIKKPLLKLIPKTLFNFASSNLSCIIQIKDFTPCLEINPEAVEYLANLSQDKLTKFIRFSESKSHYDTDIIFRNNHKKAFIFAKKKSRPKKEKELQLSDKNEDALAGTNLISSSFFSRSLPSISTYRSIEPKISTDINENTNKPKHKIKIKSRPSISSDIFSIASPPLDENKSEEAPIRSLHIEIEQKFKKHTTTNKEYILYHLARYGSDFSNETTVYAFFSDSIQNDKRIKNEFLHYVDALSGKVGDKRCPVSTDISDIGKRNGYTLKIKPFNSNIKNIGNIRIVGRNFKTIQDPENNNKFFTILLFDGIHTKKPKNNITVKTDPGLDENDPFNKIVSITIKNANNEKNLKIRKPTTP